MGCGRIAFNSDFGFGSKAALHASQTLVRLHFDSRHSKSPNERSTSGQKQRFDHIVGARREVMPPTVDLNVRPKHPLTAPRGMVMADADEWNRHGKIFHSEVTRDSRTPTVVTPLTSVNSPCQAVSLLDSLSLICDAGQMAF